MARAYTSKDGEQSVHMASIGSLDDDSEGPLSVDSSLNNKDNQQDLVVLID